MKKIFLTLIAVIMLVSAAGCTKTTTTNTRYHTGDNHTCNHFAGNNHSDTASCIV